MTPGEISVLVRKHLGLDGARELTDPNREAPKFDTFNGECKLLADIYDSAMQARGSDKRALRSSARGRAPLGGVA